MSAIAALLSPPKVRHIASRLVIDGKTIEKRSDLPPLPNATIRNEVKEKITALRKKKWAAANPESARKAAKKYAEVHSEKIKKSKDEWYRKNGSEYHRQYRIKNHAKRIAYEKAYRERKRNEKAKIIDQRNSA